MREWSGGNGMRGGGCKRKNGMEGGGGVKAGTVGGNISEGRGGV